MIRCPFCRQEMTTIHPVNSAPVAPRVKDFTLCAGCGEWGVFDGAGGIRKPTAAEYEILVGNANAQRLRDLWLHTQDEPETLAGKFTEFMSSMPKMPPKGTGLCEASFYAGAFSFFAILRDAAQKDGDGALGAGIDIMMAELRAFAESKEGNQV